MVRPSPLRKGHPRSRDRRLHLTVGLLGFLFFHITFLPWPFYEGPLDRPPIENGTIMSNTGGCAWKYDWCDHTPRVPKPLYLVSASVVLGFSFPLVAAPCNTILSEIVGPRKQGMVQGLFALTGSLCQFILPILSAYVAQSPPNMYSDLHLNCLATSTSCRTTWSCWSPRWFSSSSSGRDSFPFVSPLRPAVPRNISWVQCIDYKSVVSITNGQLY